LGNFLSESLDSKEAILEIAKAMARRDDVIAYR
jgi:hypothetical protein